MEFEMLASGYGLLEAPRVDDLGRFYFTDIPNGGVYRRNPGGNVETLIPKRKGVGGMNFNPLSNDKPIPGSLFRIDPPGRAVKLWDGIEVSNGLGFSPDRKHLYHSDYSTGAVWVYDVTHERGVKDRRIFAKMPAGMPDGLAVDAQGGVWVAAVRIGEVVHFSKEATVVERIKLPATMVTSLVFGGRDLRDLYVVTADNTDDPDRKGTIFRGRADVPGLPVPKANF